MKITLFAPIRSKIAALPEPVRIGMGLGFGFAVTLGLVIMVMIVGFIYLSKIHSDLQQIIHINNVKTELAHTMKYAQRDRSMSLYALATLSDAFDIDEELRRFDSKGAEWWRAWEEFQTMQMNPQEMLLAGHINSLALERNAAMLETVDMAVTKHNKTVLEHITKDAIPGQKVLSDEIDKLLKLQQLQTNEAALGAEESYAKARLFLLWLCILTIVMSMLVGLVVVRQVMRQSHELEQKALFDELTGLPNRSLFFDRLDQAAAAYADEQKPFSVVIVDLDRFKEVNDAQGHHVGDLLLKHVAQSISVAMRRTDTVARLGGDEFVILLPSAGSENADVIIKKLVTSLHQRVSLDGNIVDVAASMGVACYPEHDTDIARLLLKADIAMYAAKRANLGYRIYTPEIEAVAARNVEMQNELRYAIDHEQLTLHYQPKISHQTSCIMGVEALVRWNHPQKGMIAPDEFIPLAEACGLIQPLAGWVLQAAAEQLARWHAAGKLISVSVNLSTRNLLDGDLSARVELLLEAYKVKPAYLVFEITESAVMSEPKRALETLTKLSNMGIQLSLDDFGTGYSSLAYLKKMPVNEIKIDKSFVKDMERDSSDTVIVRSTIALGHNLGMKVVAEGVENSEIWELLTQLGCDASQGYFMSRPLSADGIDEWLKTSPWAIEKIKPPEAYPGLERRKTVRVTLS